MNLDTYRAIRDLAYQGKKQEILANFSLKEIKEAYKLVGANWNLNHEQHTPRWCYVIRDCARKVSNVVRG